uniref:Uncharacterized protein n=1 Tax=Prochlorococcus marinus str. P0902-H212 TaxID=1620696 RepID=A0A0D5A2V1_PROMR|nr:hypothetical protein FA02_0242 [Prochlorococcus marinus str. P0902-H212]
MNFAESRISCFQSIFSCVEFCPQLLEGSFTETRNTRVVIWKDFIQVGISIVTGDHL